MRLMRLNRREVARNYKLYIRRVFIYVRLWTSIVCHLTSMMRQAWIMSLVSVLLHQVPDIRVFV